MLETVPKFATAPLPGGAVSTFLFRLVCAEKPRRDLKTSNSQDIRESMGNPQKLENATFRKAGAVRWGYFGYSQNNMIMFYTVKGLGIFFLFFAD